MLFWHIYLNLQKRNQINLGKNTIDPMGFLILSIQTTVPTAPTGPRFLRPSWQAFEEWKVATLPGTGLVKLDHVSPQGSRGEKMYENI